MAVEGIFGPVIFGKALGRIMTYSEIKRSYKGRFGSHMVHLRKPLLEWAGNDLVRIDMQISLNSAWCGDPQPLLALWHLLHENAIAAPLVASGRPMGPGFSMFVITEMTERHKHWLDHGRLIAAELDVHFEEYIPSTDTDMTNIMGGVPGFNTGGTVSVGPLENVSGTG